MTPIGTIIKAVAAEYGLVEANILSSRRDRLIARPRQVCYWIAKRVAGVSVAQIGRDMGKDHTTIMFGVKAIKGLMEIDTEFAERVNALEESIVSGRAVISANSREACLERQIIELKATIKYLREQVLFSSPIVHNQQKKRSCMCCGTEFMSVGNHNRLCPAHTKGDVLPSEIDRLGF